MFTAVWEIFIAAASFLGASYVWLLAVPLPPDYSRLGITLSSLMFALVSLYFAYRVCRAGWRSAILLLLIVATTQALIVYHILTTPFFKI